MAHVDQPYQTKEVAQFLVQVREQGTPLRVDSDTETYYVLTATQLQQLLFAAFADDAADSDFAADYSFTPADFGLTEADIAAYEAKQQQQRAALNLQKQQAPAPELIRRLEALPRLERLFPKRAATERTELLRELETVMLANLRAALPDAELA